MLSSPYFRKECLHQWRAVTTQQFWLHWLHWALKTVFLGVTFQLTNKIVLKFVLRKEPLLYGLQQPACVLCQKLVTFCFSLSHFCYLFWIVSIKTDICFIWQLCGQSMNLAPVFKSFFFRGPPGAPKSPKKPHKNLSKTWLDLTLWL